MLGMEARLWRLCTYMSFGWYWYLLFNFLGM